MKVLRWLDDNFEMYFVSTILSIMVVVVACQVLFRAIGWKVAWQEEIARYLSAWLIHISVALCIKKKKHISVDILPMLLKTERQHVILTIITDIAFFAFAVCVFFPGYGIINKLMFVSVQRSASMRIPMWIPYLSFEVGSLIWIIRLIQDIYLQLKSLKSKEGGVNTQL